MSEKKSVGILFGGRSVEHDISIRSATNVFQYIDKDKFQVTLIGIDRAGAWYLNDNPEVPISQGEQLTLLLNQGNSTFMKLKNNQELGSIDVFFPVLHGTDGEDGSIQGLFNTVNKPVVGSGVLGSSVSMNKLISKKLLIQAGIPVADYIHCDFTHRQKISFEETKNQLGLPFMVKPVMLGSSVGVSKVTDSQSFQTALEQGFRYDNQIILEKYIMGREFECAVMGNEKPQATAPGEILLNQDYDFYSFDAKYVDESAASIQIPAKVDADKVKTIQSLAIASYQALACEDYSRVDLFLDQEGFIFINEINTIPGFTNISMFPKLWEYAGISYPELITKLITYACERFDRKSRLSTHYETNLN